MRMLVFVKIWCFEAYFDIFAEKFFCFRLRKSLHGRQLLLFASMKCLH